MNSAIQITVVVEIAKVTRVVLESKTIPVRGFARVHEIACRAALPLRCAPALYEYVDTRRDTPYVDYD